jgi:hypothetical protein
MKTTFSLTYLGLFIFSLFLFGCFTPEDDDDSSTGTATPTTTTSGATTTITVTDSASCPLSSTTGKYECSGGTGTANVLFSASATASIYYDSNIGSAPTITTSDASFDTSGDADFSGSDRDNLYVSYYSVGASGTESTKTAIIYFVDIHPPTSSIASAILQDNSSDSCSYNGSTYYCDSKATIKLTADEPATIWWTTGTLPDPGTSPVNTGSSCNPAEDPCTIPIESDDAYIRIAAVDQASPTPLTETSHSYDFQISNTGIYDIECGGKPIGGGGYCNKQVKFRLKKADNVSIPSPGYYQLWYRKISGIDVSADTSGDTVFDATGDPTSTAIRYLNFYPTPSIYDSYPDEIIADITTDTGGNDKTAIYQYKYATVYGGSYKSSTTGVTDGSTDAESYSVFYVDTDKPNLTVIPPSSGTMNSSMKIMPFVQDPGHDKVARYAATNSALSGATPLQNATSNYCQITEATDDLFSYAFWQSCSDNRNSYSANNQLILAANTYLGFYGSDAAGNQSTCDNNKQNSCIIDRDKEVSPTSNEPMDILEYYTPGIFKSSVYPTINKDEHTNFGHAVLSADLDGGTYKNDIIITAPAYSYTDTADATTDKGAVYIWYNAFRERAQIRLGLGDATMDVSGSKTLTFATDGGTSMSVTLDPSNDTLGLALASDYQDKTAATTFEIAKVLNRAFLNSYGTDTNGNYLFAMATDATGDLMDATFDATTDGSTNGYITIGHINRTISNWFTISTVGFDTTSDFNLSSKTVRAYDYAFFGENDDDEFGYSIAVDTVDTSRDTVNYSTKNLIVGAPGYNNDAGAVYVLKLPKTDASADSQQVLLSNSLNYNAHRISGASADGRLGMALVTYDKNGDNYNDIFVSAPYLDSGATSAGGIYQINADNFDFELTTDTTSSIDNSSDTGGANDSIIWNTSYSAFGYSMVIGATTYFSGESVNRLYVGAPGSEVAGNKGQVHVYHLNQTGYTNARISAETTEYNEKSDNLFGTSLAIVNYDFDSTSCPCLLVGSPGSRDATDDANSIINKKGKVWVLGSTLKTYIEGTQDNEMLGSKVFTGIIDSSGFTDTAFVTSKHLGASKYDGKGKVTIIRPQTIGGSSTSPGLLATSVSISLNGNNSNENFGLGLGSVQYNSTGSKALVIGAPGNDDDMQGSVQITSATKLGF